MHLANSAWILGQMLTKGVPRRLVRASVGVGDELMAAAAIRQTIPTRDRGQWFAARYPSLHRATEWPLRVVSYDPRHFRMAERLHRPIVTLEYADVAAGGTEHHIAAMARQLGATGRIALRPELHLTAAERAAGRLAPDQIVVQSATRGRIPMLTKQWPADRMQQVVDGLNRLGRFRILQLGAPEEPALSGVTDLRGKTSLREAAALIAESRVFVGLLSGLMHLARAVDCPAVIVFGGREPVSRAGYRANVNLVRRPDCSPCYRRDDCPNELVCLTEISPAEVMAAIERVLAAERTELPVDTVELGGA